MAASLPFRYDGIRPRTREISIQKIPCTMPEEGWESSHWHLLCHTDAKRLMIRSQYWKGAGAPFRVLVWAAVLF